ncbi:putative ADP-ribosylation factor GTPase-activating protein AGD11-like protein [Tanacetum coccineum]|uniref:ADP-ribosylation factor GTPase-activating protein AGD11-like protein n=1 Tax=Tanacetum coccineum TaxID=301880 RepID=A0ABQ5B2E8_9ASTR
MLQFKKKKDHVGKSGGNRILIKINVVGSAGPIRFVVDEDELVASVINIAIKMYAREGRLPVLGTKLNEFFLYTPIVGSEETIAANGSDRDNEKEHKQLEVMVQ